MREREWVRERDYEVPHISILMNTNSHRLQMCRTEFIDPTPAAYSQVGGNLNLVAHVNFPEDDGIVQVESEREREKERLQGERGRERGREGGREGEGEGDRK